jgi:hypothetical protein
MLTPSSTAPQKDIVWLRAARMRGMSIVDCSSSRRSSCAYQCNMSAV